MMTQPDVKSARLKTGAGRMPAVFLDGTPSANLPTPADEDSPLVAGRALLTTPEEALVADTRAGLTPSELVERKLISLLKSSALPISHVQMVSTGLSRGR